ncbi:hypothetical protein glysoja_047147 [Glycine soja]|uniref:Uncharacterized protein n=1 Tax=Glycine soja TaxID=3848 RepID=A0A0B2SSL0_GLYSO|nr:hypothetical protein glysoja_047147 [Glycine soja]
MSQRGSQFSAPTHVDINVLSARVSTKGSNAKTGVNPSKEEHVAHVTPTMGFMVYADGVVRVRVEKVIVGVAEVPLSTYKIQYDSVITPNKVTQAVEGVNDVAIHDPLRAEVEKDLRIQKTMLPAVGQVDFLPCL